MRASTVFAFLCIGFLRPGVSAQTIRWDPSSGTIAVGQTTSLQLVCEDCEPKETPVPPKVNGLSIAFAGQSSNMSFINGSYSHSTSYTFAVLLTKNARIEIPSFEIETDKGRIRVAAARFDPGNATVGNTGQPLESAANSHFDVNPSSVWAGEVFDLAYSIEATRSYYPDFGRGVFDWNPDPLVVEDWSKPEPFETRAGSEAQTGLAYHTRAIAPKSGSFHLNSVNQLVNLSVGISGFGFFQQRQYQQFSVTSPPATVSVRPLPPAPAGFSGAVGNFKLTSKVVPESAGVGDPVTWTLELNGTGNWPNISGLPARNVSKDFQVIQPQAKRTPAEGKLFDSKLTEDVVLVPTRPGTYDLPAVHFIYFNPKSGTYETLTAAGATVTVTAPANATNTNQVSGAGPLTAPTVGPNAASSLTPPPVPTGLPRDPLSDIGTAWPPFGTTKLTGLLLAPFAILAGFWLWLAGQRARQTDPERWRRRARLQIAATLEKIRACPSSSPAADPSLPSLLLAWQHDATQLWGIDHAAPMAAVVGDPAWVALWSEADHTLYGANAPLPADWVARAGTALEKKSVPPFAFWQAFRLRNLFPFLFAAALLITGTVSRGTEEVSAYRRGDFVSAEKGWRAAETQEPTAWPIRHNLSLALGQQDRWDEAAAQATAAFVQQPGNAAVRWQFELACSKAGFVPQPLEGFISPGPVVRLARLASPPAWQMILVVAACLAAVALGALIAASYRSVSGLRPIASAILALALLLSAAGVVGWRAYGMAAESRAVMVWRNGTLRSIPTEADTAQKTAPLAAGSVARADKTFLGWERLSFDNGQTGWVRKEELVWLWR